MFRGHVVAEGKPKYVLPAELLQDLSDSPAKYKILRLRREKQIGLGKKTLFTIYGLYRKAGTEYPLISGDVVRMVAKFDGITMYRMYSSLDPDTSPRAV